MVSNAFTDMTNLGDLLAESPDLTDAPGAQPLQLRPTSQVCGRPGRPPRNACLVPPTPPWPRPGVLQSRGPEVTFDSVAFTYGKELEGRIEARTRAQIAGDDEAAGRVKPLSVGARVWTWARGKKRGGKGAASAVAAGSDDAETAPLHTAVDVGAGEGKEASGRAGSEAPPRVILRGVSFTIAPGTTTAVCGQTGAGEPHELQICVSLRCAYAPFR
jgi:ABC-type multidrug transport system fused ATPase/permease subunit